MPSGSATTIDHLGVSSWLCAGLSWLVRGHGGVCGLYMVDFDVGLLGLVRCFERGGAWGGLVARSGCGEVEPTGGGLAEPAAEWCLGIYVDEV